MLRDTYPKIAITAEDPLKAIEIKHLLLKNGIFSDVLTLDDTRKRITDFSLIIFYSERYSSRIVSVINSIEKNSAITKTLFIGESKSFTNAKFDVCVSYADAVHDNCITHILLGFLNDDIFHNDEKHLVTDLCLGHLIIRHGMKIFLSQTEALLVHFLARASLPFATAFDISYYLDIKESSVPVVIASINAKTKSILSNPIIKFKRNFGYYILK